MRDLPTSQLKHLADRIHAGLRRINTKKAEGADTDFCLAEAFDFCAAAVRDCGYELNDEVVRKDIPVLIAHWAKAWCWLSAVPAAQWTEFLVKSMTSRAAPWRAESVVSQESQSSPLVQQNGIVPRRFTWVEVWREMPEALHYERMHCLAENFFVETGAGWRRILSRKLARVPKV
jgi:hypothetical protein